MELIIRSAVIYFILLIVFSIAGKRQLAEVDTFRLVLILIISEATQEALIDQNHSLTGAVLVICTLVVLEMVMSFLKSRFHSVEKLVTGGPLVLIDRGKALEERM